MRDLKIAYGSSCFAVKWSNKTIGWEELCQRLATTVRTPETVACRSMLALDADHADTDFLDRYELLGGYTACAYSTHGHVPDTPRLRMIIPLSRDVTPDEYNAVARFVADSLGIDSLTNVPTVPIS